MHRPSYPRALFLFKLSWNSLCWLQNRRVHTHTHKHTLKQSHSRIASELGCLWMSPVHELRAMAGCRCQHRRGLGVSTRPGCCACTHTATGAANTGYQREIPRATLAPHSSSPLKAWPWTQCLALLTAQLELFPVPQCHGSCISNGIRKERLQLS